MSSIGCAKSSASWIATKTDSSTGPNCSARRKVRPTAAAHATANVALTATARPKADDREDRRRERVNVAPKVIVRVMASDVRKRIVPAMVSVVPNRVPKVVRHVAEKTKRSLAKRHSLET